MFCISEKFYVKNIVKLQKKKRKKKVSGKKKFFYLGFPVLETNH